MIHQTVIHVVGIGLDGAAGLAPVTQQIIAQARLLVGSSRHLSYFPQHSGDRLVLGDLGAAVAQLHQVMQANSSAGAIVILTSGDPLFFGLGRLLLLEFSAAHLTFHPHLSSIQLAFNRIKLPWQGARVISAHGRSLEELTQALQQGSDPIAVLTDPTHTPGAIARLVRSLDLPTSYKLWVCENLGGTDERITSTIDLEELFEQSFASLNVVVLQRLSAVEELDLSALPLLGISDGCFLSFPDRPGLMTKREVRVQVLGELGLQPGQTVWDVGAGTGSVSIELARLCPSSRVYAIEKTAIGATVIQQNCQRFQVRNVVVVQGTAPESLAELPPPDRIFIGGSGGNLTDILTQCTDRLQPQGRIVLALTTLEHLTTALTWLNTQPAWNYRLLQLQLARSIPIATLTRFSPLNPVTLVVMERKS